MGKYFLDSDIERSKLGEDQLNFFYESTPKEMLPSERRKMATRRSFQRGVLENLRSNLAIQKEQRLSRQSRVAENLAFEKESFEREKWMMNKFIELYSKARNDGDIALQENLMSQGNNFLGALSPQSKQLMIPILESSPFSPTRQRMREYDKMFPAPRISASMDQEPYLYARQAWDLEDWEARRESYITGKSPRKRSLIALDADKDRFSYRDSSGRIHTASSDTLQLQGFADRTESTIAEVLANGGAYIGEKRTVVIDGYEYDTRTFLPYGASQAEVRTTPKGETPELRGKKKLSRDFMANYGLDEPTDKIASNVLRMEEAGRSFDEISDAYLYPLLGYSYRKHEKAAGKLDHFLDIINPFVDSVKGNFLLWGGTKKGADMLIQIDGAPVQVIEGEPDSTVFVNRETRMTYDAVGRPLGTWEEAQKKVKEAFGGE